ncbi:hypothetical protein O7626_25945 [Micromonospora sp. WMMD1102]|uniref:hypothetical protein n=1 Tax=Micromonospora sp. WMMD1102 TaxID=3016105 RepID=UPI0024151DA1|nr:hypothetical protein [Micromonospora sp. WMMD1102]MDG4789325.1 hypothetical protein [Micromonospora sp. WMMD1102]
MDHSSAGSGRTESAHRHAALRRWPSLLGLATAASLLGLAVAVPKLVFGAGHEAVAIVVCVAALCYLSAAALGRPWVAWAAIGGASVLVTVSKIAGLAWWGVFGVAAVALVAVGLLRRVPGPAFTAQVAALVGYGGLAVATGWLPSRTGLVLVGLLLASHGIWDLVHYRRDRVVSRSLAECCMLLDVPLGLGAVVLAFLV